MSELFANKTVFVTGAGQGIGFGLCQAFAQAGAQVALNDIDEHAAQAAAKKINTAVSASRVIPYAFDVADGAAVQTALYDFADRHNRLDVVIANAGITQYGRFLDDTPADFDQVMAVNLRGSYFTAQAAARKMIALGAADGRILLMASVTGLRAFRSLGAYGITKAGIIHMARVLALELGEHHITVNALCPGATMTERTIYEDPDYEEKWAGVTPSGRVSYVQDITVAALFLASAQARQITGQMIQVDGGWTLRSPTPADHPD